MVDFIKFFAVFYSFEKKKLKKLLKKPKLLHKGRKKLSGAEKTLQKAPRRIFNSQVFHTLNSENVENSKVKISKNKAT